MMGSHPLCPALSWLQQGSANAPLLLEEEPTKRSKVFSMPGSPCQLTKAIKQSNLLSGIPQLLNDLQATLPAEYNVLAGLVSLPPAFTFCPSNSDNFSDRTNAVSAHRSFSFPMLSAVGPCSAPG